MFKVHRTEVVTIAQRLEHTTESVSQVWFAEFAHGIFQANFLEDRNFVFGKSSKTKLVFSFGTGIRNYHK